MIWSVLPLSPPPLTYITLAGTQQIVKSYSTPPVQLSPELIKLNLQRLQRNKGTNVFYIDTLE